MTWQLASFLVLALALAGGVSWYERSRPPARTIAVVATLAALAVLGRIAFAPIPNVKPTTDIVLLTGYVFGGPPGFAVGAVAALVSNVFFAQGPWTPWQMAAWGAVGAGGALLARLDGGRARRLPLALACGVAGLAFGVVVNFGSVVTVGDADLWRRFALYETTSLPWDLTHAAGNVAFFFLFGPALVRTLRRFRTRLEFTWRPAPAQLGAVAAAVLAAGALASAGTPPARADTSVATLHYIERAQNADGGFGARPGAGSVDLLTGWAALGAAALGRNPRDLKRSGGRSAIDYVAAHAGGVVRDGSAAGVGGLERTILVVRAAGLSPRAFAGRDLVGALTRRVDGSGSVLRQVNLTAFGILALRAGGVPARGGTIARAAAWLARQQNADGGYSFAERGGASDIDDTGATVQALVAAGGSRAAIRRAVTFLRRAQNPDGGLPQQPGGASNAQSTAWAVQGLVAAGVQPGTVRRGGARSPLAYLASLAAPDGSVQYSRTSSQTPVWVTAMAALGLARRAFPLAPVTRASGAATPGGAGAGSGAAAGGGAAAGIGAGSAGAGGSGAGSAAAGGSGGGGSGGGSAGAGGAGAGGAGGGSGSAGAGGSGVGGAGATGSGAAAAGSPALARGIGHVLAPVARAAGLAVALVGRALGLG